MNFAYFGSFFFVDRMIIAHVQDGEFTREEEDSSDEKTQHLLNGTAVISISVSLFVRFIECIIFFVIKAWSNKRENFLAENQTQPIMEYDEERLKSYFTQ